MDDGEVLLEPRPRKGKSSPRPEEIIIWTSSTSSFFPYFCENPRAISLWSEVQNETECNVKQKHFVPSFSFFVLFRIFFSLPHSLFLPEPSSAFGLCRRRLLWSSYKLIAFPKPHGTKNFFPVAGLTPFAKSNKVLTGGDANWAVKINLSPRKIELVSGVDDNNASRCRLMTCHMAFLLFRLLDYSVVERTGASYWWKREIRSLSLASPLSLTFSHPLLSPLRVVSVRNRFWWIFWGLRKIVAKRTWTSDCKSFFALAG